MIPVSTSCEIFNGEGFIDQHPNVPLRMLHARARGSGGVIPGVVILGGLGPYLLYLVAEALPRSKLVIFYRDLRLPLDFSMEPCSKGICFWMRHFSTPLFYFKGGSVFSIPRGVLGKCKEFQTEFIGELLRAGHCRIQHRPVHKRECWRQT